MSAFLRLLTRTARILDIRVPARQIAAIFMMLALMMPIAAPIPAWAYSLNLPSMPEEPSSPSSAMSSVAGLSELALTLPDVISAFLSAPAARDAVSKKTKSENRRKDLARTFPHDIDDSDKIVAASEAERTENVPVVSAGAISNPAAPVLVVNQLPDAERESVYTYENNLGSPPGQVEADSQFHSTTTPIKHRPTIGNFNFGIPLASLAGRGIDAGVGLTYNSRTWNESCIDIPCTQKRFTYDVEQSWVAPGFSSGVGHLNSNQHTRSVLMDDGDGGWVIRTLTEIIPEGFTDADGTRHQISCKTMAHIPTGNPAANYCSTYGSSDGTFIKVTRESTSQLNPNYRIGSGVDNTLYGTISFTVLHANGTKVTYSTPFGSGNNRKHYPTSIRDRNGNKISISYKADQSGRIDYINDTLNRKIKFYYENDANGNPDKLVAVTIPGMGTNEEIQTVRFYYTPMMLEPGGFSGNAVVTAPATPIDVLLYVYFPANDTGFKYIYHPKYGMIKDIVRFAGMQVSTTATNETGTITYEGTYAAMTQYDFPAGNSPDVPKYTKRTDDWAGRLPGEPLQETFYDVQDLSRTSTITVRGELADIETKNITNASGMIQETAVSELSGGEPGNRTERKLMSRNRYTWSGGRNLTKLETTNDAGLSKATVFVYDGYGNQTSVQEHGYAAEGTLGTLLRTTEMTYETGAGWLNNNLVGLVKSVKTVVGGVTVSKTLFEYDHGGSDGPLIKYADIGGYDASYNPLNPPRICEQCCPDPEDPGSCPLNLPEGYTVIFEEEDPPSLDPPCPWFCTGDYLPSTAYRGNVTKVARMLDVNAATADENRDDVTEMNYDIAGNVVSATLSCCQEKTIEYGQSYSVTGYAFPVKETKGSSPQLENLATYNRNTGLMLTSTNENGQMTQYQYEEDTLRPKKTIFSNTSETLVEYSDKVSPATPLPGFVRQTTTLDVGKNAVSYSYFDARGLGIRSATQTPDGWSISAVEYDQLGRPRKSYNPFYGSTPLAAVPAGTAFTSMTQIDSLGRNTLVTLQDNTTVTTYFSASGDIPSGFNKTFITVTDQAGKQRRQIADALGRIVRVDEPDASGNLGAVDAPAQPTVYEYDGNDNLAKVIQSDGTVTQERRFKYDSLSRLSHERQVEATPTLDDNGMKGAADPNKWTKYLKYKPDGLLDYGVDARGVRTTFAYDGLNRVTSVAYTGETGYTTPNVTYIYDQARSGHFNAGALTRVETLGVGDTPAAATEFDYDLMGRVVKHRQTIGTQTYNLEYGYNLAGQLVSEKYPSGKIVTTNYDANGRLSGIADEIRSFASNFQYQQHGGALSGMTLGNGTTESFALNNRLQMTGQELKRGTEVLQKYDYGYGELDPQGVLKNNGKLESVVSHIGTVKQWTQKFKYDSIGRLSESEEKRGDTNALTYKQNFDFDRFGNMYRKAVNNNPTGQENPLPYTPIEDADISKQTNRFTTETTYDDAGNVTTDNKFRDMSFGYDANGRMVKAIRASVPDALSVYDAGGLRVAEKVNDVWRYLVYDIGGKLVAEYGGPSTTEDGIKYVHQDWQGSTRTATSNAGFVQSRTDYSAFGEEISAGTGQRTALQGFGAANNVRQKYGLTERDDATGLDHTWFRKNENQAGRWTSPDPYNGSMNLGDPQSFNRYSYVQNQPTNFIDPSGLQLASYCSVGFEWRPHIEGGGDWVVVERCYLVDGGSVDTGRRGPWDPEVGGGGGNPSNPQGNNCGVNPVTGQPGLRNDPIKSRWDRRPGGIGNLRPGEGGAGGFRERTGGKHDAVDIVAPIATPILANRDGTVTSGNTSGYGNWVVVSHGGTNTLYAHLSSITVGSGMVSQGQEIGKAGITGNASNLTKANGLEKEQHVHFGVFEGASTIPSSGNARFKDPATYLNSRCPPAEGGGRGTP